MMYNNTYGPGMITPQQQIEYKFRKAESELRQFIEGLRAASCLSNEQYNTLQRNFTSYLGDVWAAYQRNNYNDYMLNDIFRSFLSIYSVPSTFNAPVRPVGINYPQQYNNNQYIGGSYSQVSGNLAQDLYGKQGSPVVGNISLPQSNQDAVVKVTQPQEAIPIGVRQGMSQDEIGKKIARSSTTFSGPMAKDNSHPLPIIVKSVEFPKPVHQFTSNITENYQAHEFKMTGRNIMNYENGLSLFVSSPEAAICHAKESRPELVTGTYANLLSYGELNIAKTDYFKAKSVYEKCMTLYNDVKKDRTKVDEIIKVLNAEGKFGEDLKNQVYEMFNNCVAVMMHKMFDDGRYMHMDPATDDRSFRSFFRDEEDIEFKQDQEEYLFRLDLCVTNSFGAMFDMDKDSHVIDIEKDLERQLVMASDLIGYTFTVGEIESDSRMVLPYISTDDGKQREIDIEALNKDLATRIFPYKIKRTICYHNLGMEVPEWFDRSVWAVRESHHQLLINKMNELGHKCITMIDDSDRTQLVHPIMVGTTFEGVPIMRRIFH